MRNQLDGTERGEIESGAAQIRAEGTDNQKIPSTEKNHTTLSSRFDDACENGRTDEVKEILKQAARTDPGTGKGKSKEGQLDGDSITRALFYAMDKGNNDVAKIIAKNKMIKLDIPYGVLSRTVLHEAIAKNLDVIARELLLRVDSSHYVNLKDADGRTTLHEAASRGSLKVIRDLLVNRADINATDNQLLTPLHLVIIAHGVLTAEEETVKLLLDKGAEVNTKDQYGDSPLHDACGLANSNIMKLLLEYGADPDSRNNMGATPEALLPNDSKGTAAKSLFTAHWGLNSKYPQRMPSKSPQCSGEKKKVCDRFFVTVRFYWRPEGISWSHTTSVYKLVYVKNTLKDLQDEFLRIIKRHDEKNDVNPKDIWKWVHFPANNISWVKDFIWRLSNDSKKPNSNRFDIWKFFERSIKARRPDSTRGCTRMPHVGASRQDGSDGEAYQTSPVHDQAPDVESPGSIKRRGLAVTPNKNVNELAREAWRTTHALPKKNRVSLVIPFIDFENELYLGRHENIRHRTRRFRWMADLEEIYMPFTGLSGLQAPQTLDESYYDMLDSSELKRRDQDQQIYKRTLPDTTYSKTSSIPDQMDMGWESTKSDVESSQAAVSAEIETTIKDEPIRTEDPTKQVVDKGIEAIPKKQKTKQKHGDKEIVSTAGLRKLLMVHQLWLWKLDDSTVITSLPERWHTGIEYTLLETIRQSGIHRLREPEELIKHIVYECVTFLDEFKYAGLGDHILDIYESAIATLSNEEVTCFKEFIDSVRKDRAKRKKPSVDDTLDSVRINKESMRIEKEISWIYDIKDIRDELHLIRRIFENQYAVIEKFSEIFWPGFVPHHDSCRKQFISDCSVRNLIERVTKLDGDSTRTLEALDYLVQIKQAQSSLEEAEVAGDMNKKAHEQSKRSQRLNNWIMIFTVVTVIFTPLSFMTSLFAINVEQWPHQNGTLTYSDKWITGRMFGGELTVLAVVIVSGIILWKSTEDISLKERFLRWRPARSEDSVAIQSSSIPGKSYLSSRYKAYHAGGSMKQASEINSRRSALKKVEVHRSSVGSNEPSMSGRDRRLPFLTSVPWKRTNALPSPGLVDLERQPVQQPDIGVWRSHLTDG